MGILLRLAMSRQSVQDGAPSGKAARKTGREGDFRSGRAQKNIAKAFKKETAAVLAAIAQEDAQELEKRMEGQEEIDIQGFMVKKDMIQFKKSKKKFFTESFVPNVIEPSFGIGRLIYACLEHNYACRENDAERRYFTIPAMVSPYKCSVLPISNKPEFDAIIKSISDELKDLSVPHKVDKSSGSIGKRYARTDEIAIPFGITIDFHSTKISPPTVTVRDRDTLSQIRVSVDQLATLIHKLSTGRTTWAAAQAKFPNNDEWMAQNPLED